MAEGDGVLLSEGLASKLKTVLAKDKLRQRGRVEFPRKVRVATPKDTLLFKNAAGETIPMYGVMRVSAARESAGRIIYDCAKPNGSGELFLLNGNRDADTASNSLWPCFPFGRALYDESEGTPVVGEIWGPGSDFKIHKWLPGFAIAGNAADGVVAVLPSSRRRFKAKADGAITAGSSGTVSIWANGSDTGVNVTAHLNWMDGGEDISSGVELLIEWFPDESKWVIVGADCEA